MLSLLYSIVYGISIFIFIIFSFILSLIVRPCHFSYLAFIDFLMYHIVRFIICCGRCALVLKSWLNSDTFPSVIDVDEHAFARRIGRNIRELRTMYGITQTELAKSIDSSVQAVSAIELGKYNPGIYLLYRLSILFSVPVSAFLDKDLNMASYYLKKRDEDGNVKSILPYAISPLESDLLLHIHYLSEEDQRELYDEVSARLSGSFHKKSNSQKS